jgi:formate/nitrite transporter FocA (FNT family)
VTDPDGRPAGGRGSHSETVQDAFARSVEEGVVRLERSSASLIATGLVGGLDVGVGVFALFIVEHETGSRLLGALAFGIGFLALTLARSELFTENFLVPINAVVEKRAPWWSVLRLWAGTAVFNLVGAWLGMGLLMMGFPQLRATAVEIASHPVSLGLGRETFANAILGGVVITLMTWMQHSSDDAAPRIVAAWAIAFVLAGAPLQHAIVISVEIFAALHAGAGFGYADWLGTAGFAALGNMVGGVGLVTALRLLQIGPDGLRMERQGGVPRVPPTPDVRD